MAKLLHEEKYFRKILEKQILSAHDKKTKRKENMSI